MSEINNLQQAARIADLGIGVPSPEKKDPSALGQKQFFELMVAQLKNQDPLKPLDSTQFLSQLAQFSTVTGINGVQQSVQSLAGSLQSSQALQASTMVGREVLVRGDRALLSAGGTVAGAVDLATPSADLVVRISDPAGGHVRSIDLGAQPGGKVNFEWDGLVDGGGSAAPGYYQVQALANGDSGEQAVPTLLRAHVDSVTLNRNPAGVTLNLQGVGAVDMNQIDQLL